MAKSDKKPSTNGRILLVDDDAEIIESLRLALEAHDYEVLIARDGKPRAGADRARKRPIW